MTQSKTAAGKQFSRADVARKIRSMLALAGGSGATEGEAIAAAAMARKLMDEHEIGLTEATLLEDGFDGEESSTADPETFMIQLDMVQGVALFCEVRSWINIRNTHARTTQGDMFGKPSTYEAHGEVKAVHFFGLKRDVAFATWLMQAMEGFVKRGANQYAADVGGVAMSGHRRPRGRNGGGARETAETIKHKRLSYITGAARQINERLVQEWRTRQASRPGGRGLVVIDKSLMIRSEMAKRGIVLEGPMLRDDIPVADEQAFMAGMTAQFGRPLTSSARNPLELTHD
jgi:hypothetical protein